MTLPFWLRRTVRNRQRHANEQASRRWRGGRRDDSARTRRQILISTQVQKQEPHRLRQEGGGPGIAGPDGPRLLEERAGFRARRGVYRVIVFTGVAAADAHPDAVHDDVWLDAVDVRALDLPQARGPVHGPVGLTVVLYLLVCTPYAPREREPYGALGQRCCGGTAGEGVFPGLQSPSRPVALVAVGSSTMGT